jgi:hypothetical protein
MIQPIIPGKFRQHFGSPSFWARWHAGGDGTEALANSYVSMFPLSGDTCIELITSRGLSRVSLRTSRAPLSDYYVPIQEPYPTADPINLRWAEVDLICRLSAVADRRLPHPGPLALLLARFTPVYDDADAALAYPLLAAAGRWAEDTTDHRSRFDRRATGLKWVQSLDGWFLQPPTGRHPATGRRYEETEPNRWRRSNGLTHCGETARAYRESVPANWRTADICRLAAAAVADPVAAPLLADALFDAGGDRPDLEAALRSGDPVRAGWVAEWLAGDALFGASLGHPPLSAPRHEFELHLVVEGRTPRPITRPPEADLDVALRSAGVGGAYHIEGGFRYPAERGQSFVGMRVVLTGDLTAGMAVVRRTLGPVPPGTLMWQTYPEHSVERISFSPEDDQ